MRDLRIFCLPSHTFIDRISGVDFVRIIQPMNALDGYEYGDYKFRVKVFNHAKDGSFDWRDVFHDNDIVYFNYTTNDIGYAVMGLMAQKYHKILMCDFDDALHEILPDNPSYDIFKKGSWGRTVTTSIIKDVHHLTVTNSHLKHSIQNFTGVDSDKITVLPNYIDLKVYKHRSPFKDTGTYRALHFGSTTHFSDLYSEPFVKAMDRVMKEYPNFSFQTVGAFIPDFRKKWAQRYEQGFGDQDIMKWIEKMPEFMDNADFMVVPLINNSYNRSKSHIKYLEASSFKLPGIYQNIRQYNQVIENGVNGYLASTEDEWYNSMTTLIKDTKKRREMGEQSFKTIKDKWQMKDHKEEYARMFIDLIDKK